MKLKMSEIEVGMKFEDERTNKVFTVVEKNTKCKTVMLQAEGENAFSTGLATLNKWYVEVVDLEEVTTPPTEEEIKAEAAALDAEARWTSSETLTWSEMLDAFLGKVKRKVKGTNGDSTEKKERPKKDISSLIALLPFETVIPAHGGVAVKIGSRRLFELSYSSRSGVFTIASHLPTLESVGIEYEARHNYGVIKVAGEDELMEVVEKFKALTA